MFHCNEALLTKYIGSQDYMHGTFPAKMHQLERAQLAPGSGAAAVVAASTMVVL